MCDRAVHQWYGCSPGRQLTLGIGGGSMEIVFGRDAEPELSISLSQRLITPRDWECRVARRGT